MRSTPEVLQAADLSSADVERARLILEDWQLLADLGFSDLVMWVLVGDRWVAAAHARPMTGLAEDRRSPIWFFTAADNALVT